MRHTSVAVDGRSIFYREAGPADAPVLLLPHGYAFVSPIIALAAGAALFEERLGWAEIGGAILLLVAAAVALLRGKERRST